ncbi:MAG: hypothetical protein ACOYOL_08810 [Chthoniobacterales bacterium]
MKPNKYLAAAAAVLGLAGSAFAQTTVYIAGAPALRTELTTAIENLLIGQTNVVRTFNGSALITANVVRWTGANIGGETNVTVKLTYNGSAGGWLANSASKNVRFISQAGTGSGATDVLTNTTTPTVDLALPDFHISNEFQESTPWNGENSISFPENGPTTYAPLNDKIVGILPLRLVASKAAPTNLNITPQLAQQLYANGELRLSQLTGNSSDYNAKVYPLSRGVDSGIRTLWSAGNGVGSTAPIKTWQAFTANTTNKPVVGVTVVAGGINYTSAPTVTISGAGGTGAGAFASVANGRITAVTVTNGGSGFTNLPTVSFAGGGGSLASARAVLEGGSVTNQVLWAAAAAPIGTNADTRVLGINSALGNGGYPTFGPLLTALSSILNLTNVGASTNDIYFTVLGDSDADSAIKAGAKEVKWNGNTLGVLGTYGNIGGVVNSPTNVGSSTPALANGQYDLWGYARLPYRDDIVGTPKENVLTAIADQLEDFDAPVKLGDVNVNRTSDGGKILQGQFVP